MQLQYTYWPAKEGGFIGYWNDYPDHVTEGETIEELEFMLRDLRTFINDGAFDEQPRKCGVMEFA
ncbi:MAG: type II toxin-antitoxin system HicB family antitoxin [Kiritimatiellae bacterium]|nr:type II toxin-antitoxin system HicB family antitoxin [Kiritimatiellia bacterium]